jgi:hypothetical protein
MEFACVLSVSFPLDIQRLGIICDGCYVVAVVTSLASRWNGASSHYKLSGHFAVSEML